MYEKNKEVAEEAAERTDKTMQDEYGWIQAVLGEGPKIVAEAGFQRG